MAVFNTYDPKDLAVPELHGHLLGAVAPRPIAFSSTLDAEGKPNLSPFSFFNVFSANPPIMIFSPARRVRDNTTKHTLENCINTKEVVINIVNHAIVEQMSLSSTEYAEGVNEFVKSGLTMLESDKVKPFRVAESPAQFECKVNDVITLGEQGGAGNLIICEVVQLHINQGILNENGKIDPYKLDAVSRMGANYYCRAQGDSIFEVQKPLVKKGIGVDQLPAEIRESMVFNGNQLGKLANVEQLPGSEPLNSLKIDGADLSAIKQGEDRHTIASKYLDRNEVEVAWKILVLKD
jgi:flavin reductase (DIM6/NTAB) family NADH-FMN oxidoreductase RutF